jgi:hypothetical protein
MFEWLDSTSILLEALALIDAVLDGKLETTAFSSQLHELWHVQREDGLYLDPARQETFDDLSAANDLFEPDPELAGRHALSVADLISAAETARGVLHPVSEQ